MAMTNQSLALLESQPASSSTATAYWSTSLESVSPDLTSESCARSLSLLFDDVTLLTLATESSSHPAGVNSLLYQPYLYAGGGLGNFAECPLQTCVAGAGVRRDSINFASACVPFGCSAQDLAANDFNATLMRVSLAAAAAASSSTTAATTSLTTRWHELNDEYVTLLQRITEINAFLDTGWTCGQLRMPWEPWPWGYLYGFTTMGLLLLAAIGTSMRLRRSHGNHDRRKERHPADDKATRSGYGSFMKDADSDDASDDDDEALISPKGVAEIVGPRENDECSDCIELRIRHQEQCHSNQHVGSTSDYFWQHFDVSSHMKRLTTRESTETACLDGLRVGSIFWIMLGHVMAITSTSGPGFANPAAFLPPHGITTTIPGQLIFSSRFAVDTFLCISGFLVVHVLDSKLPLPLTINNRSRRQTRPAILRRYLRYLPLLLVTRAARVLPVYALSLGFYTQIAPHLGHGPFWYQWLALLRPCHDHSWTNIWFINNFVPRDTATTETCFYHSWYLAVDMQLFLVAPLLVFAYQARPTIGRILTILSFVLSVGITAYLSSVRGWSSNTFDGAAVARFDIEAYAKPYVRAQSYLIGMYVAMVLPKAALARRSPWNWMHQIALMVVLVVLAFVTFIPATGAYARRPCQYKEWPELDECGSLWTTRQTFLYTAFSRTAWSVCIAALLHLSLGRDHVVAAILSWECWRPMSSLSFAAYLIHPIVIFVWQLGNSTKQVFRLATFVMDYMSLSVMTYVLALLALLIVELPCATLWKCYTSSSSRARF